MIRDKMNLIKNNFIKKHGKYQRKYTNVLINHENKNEHLDIAINIHYQYISELKYKGIDTRKRNNYIQVWDTMINTVNNNPKINNQRASIKLFIKQVFNGQQINLPA